MKHLITAVFCFVAAFWPSNAPAGQSHTPIPDSRTITIQHKTIGVIQATWSYDQTSDSTHFLLTNLSKGKLFELTQQGLLWTTSGAFPLDTEGDVGFLIVSQVGAKAMDAKVVAALTTNDVRQIAEWSGGEFTTTKIANGQVLIKVRTYEAPHGIPKYYAWDGKTMVDISSKHPELYLKEIEEAEGWIKNSMNLPAYYYAEECRNLSIALSYSRNDKEAEQWCEMVRARFAEKRYEPSYDEAVFKAQVDQTLAEVRQRLTSEHEKNTP